MIHPGSFIAGLFVGACLLAVIWRAALNAWDSFNPRDH